MAGKIKGVHEISESEFDELSFDRDDTIFLEYDASTGDIIENGWIKLDQEDEDLIGRKFIDTFIDSHKDIAWGRNDKTNSNYEITR